jgi:thiol-disulfide isomerase/thioredoxin
MDCLAGQQLLRRDESVVCADSALQETKILAYYFSAHWCPPCRLFTPLLAEFYSVSIQDPCLYYFSAHWCPPCRLFTPLLAEFNSVSIQDP